MGWPSTPQAVHMGEKGRTDPLPQWGVNSGLHMSRLQVEPVIRCASLRVHGEVLEKSMAVVRAAQEVL